MGATTHTPDGQFDALEGRPPPRSERAEAAVRAYAEAAGEEPSPRVRALVATLGEHAPALLPLVTGDPTVTADVLTRPLEHAEGPDVIRARFLDCTAALEDGPELWRVLRKLRHREMVRIALREVLRLADVDQTSAEMAALADACVDAALCTCRRSAEARHGRALDEHGSPVPLVVLGMGKLGGQELNLGSDVDVCFFYGTDEATVGDGLGPTVHELFARVASRTAKALGEVTAEGFCFRVDLRLRPEGSRGPLVNSLASAERYYEAWGRTWERAALLRARPIAGEISFGEELLAALRPFVFRRTVDPQIAREMTEMLRRTRHELRVDGERDVKLGRGGIREAEFFVQSLQLIWGGRHPELQERGTVQALERLRAAGLVSDREADDFEASWALLRRVEHRIHMRAGYQTHAIPPRGPERDGFASSLGYADGTSLESHLGGARDRIRSLLDSLIEHEAESAPPADLERLCDRVANGASPEELAAEIGRLLPVQDPVEAASHLARLGRRAGAPLGPVGRERTPALGPLLLSEVAETADADAALRFTADFFAVLGGPGGYDRLLVEHPRLVRRLVGLFGASATLSSALVGHPEALDQLLVVGGAPTPHAIREAHRERPLAFPGGDLPDPEEFVGALRRIKREITLAVGLAHVGGELDPATTEDLLSTLAEEQIAAALRYARAETAQRLGVPAPSASPDAASADLVVVGLGKLGARELGFGGDLDMLFLYGTDGEARPVKPDRPVTHGELFTRIAQRTMRLLSQPDAEGGGYETDARLRPGGSQGTLVVSLAAFDRYHRERARPWERQALVRARAVAGSLEVGRIADERFARLAFEHGAPEANDVAEMRRRIQTELAGERQDRYHPKLGHGGLVDVEFVVQWLQMRHGVDPAVRERRTLDALQALERTGHLSPSDTAVLSDGYHFFRGVEQALRLLDETREPAVLTASRTAEQLARRLGLRERDAETRSDVLIATWHRHATSVRGAFERILAPVGLRAPWATFPRGGGT